MKIVFDLQCLQGSSRYRGIGRYSLELTKAFIRQAPQHEIYLLLNNQDLDGLEFAYNEFNSLIPKDRIKLLTLPDKIADTCYHNTWRIQATETLVEAYLANLAPDIVYILSLFEGLNNRTITSCNHLMTPYLKVITLYDLIPFIYSDFYLSKIRNKHFFLRKFQQLRKADLLISISEASAKEAIELFSLEKDKIINGSVGLDEKFITYRPEKNKFKAISLKYNINKKFIFYLGGNDFRKNILNLIKAFVASPSLWNQYQLLIITAKKSIFLDEAAAQLIKPTPLSFNDILLFDRVEEEALLTFYAHCSLFVFPSLHEGFGLPIIEAMACGAPVIGSNVSSIPEAINCAEALFDPHDPKSIAQKMVQAVENDSFNLFLRNHSRVQHKKFCWIDSAQKVLHALEDLYQKKIKKHKINLNYLFIKKELLIFRLFLQKKVASLIIVLNS
ncbi:glycosyltransferase family 4 protein [Rickettsiella massiliensis]|uniref:glycosyltransferase family 4 protein n=1 Tax=Rickettsiella massiliensis TaxID=676517 RepID=UPI0002EAD124|nr:glycosyltransferase family 1 protein [Rickettsiella massiliensis]